MDQNDNFGESKKICFVCEHEVGDGNALASSVAQLWLSLITNGSS